MKNMRLFNGMAMVVALGAGLSVAVADEQGHQGSGQKGEATPLPLCPVMGEPVDFSASVATDDGPVYFCCKNCIEKYQANPAKYAEKVAAQRKALADRPKVQVTCPVTGKPVDPNMFTEYQGKKVYFCSSACISRFKGNPDKYRARLANSYTYQTKWPVMGGDISPKAFSVLPTGQKIYYCCPGCEKKLLADPAKYAPKLAAQGINIDPAKITGAKAGGKGEHHGHEGHDH
jgi:YHS domain-containing protein